MKQKISMILAVMCLVVSISTVSYAAEGEGTAYAKASMNQGGTGIAQPYYINTASIAAGLKIEGNTAYCRAEVIAKKVCTVRIVMRLQKLEGGVWNTKVSWIESSASGVKTATKTHTLAERGSYRVSLSADVNGESVSCVSNTRTY